MKKQTKYLLKETFASIPNNFAFREIRFHVYHAMQKLEAMEKREMAKQKLEYEAREKEKELKMAHPWMPPIYQDASQTRNTLDIIDKMIAQEQKVIHEIRHKKSQPQVKPSETQHDYDEGDETQTLHG